MTLSATDLVLSRRLNGVFASFRPGEITAVCGPNGAGKSSLLAALAGLIDPAQGTVALEGAPLLTMPPRQRARAIGYLPQSPDMAWDVDVKTLAGLGRLPWQGGAGHRNRASAALDREAVGAALAALDLEAFAARRLSTLSGGERARALLARVLAGQPRWVLADEPLAALDLGHQLVLLRHFRALASGGVGVVLVLHDLALAMNHADRVIVLDRGRVCADGPPGESLCSPVVSQVWGVKARWIGEAGACALVTG